MSDEKEVVVDLPSANADAEATKPETEQKPEAATEEQPSEATAEEPAPQEDPDDKPRRPNQRERMRRRIMAMSTEIDSLRSQLDESQKARGSEQAPKEADFNGDYIAWQTALNAHNSRQAVREEFAEQSKRDLAQRQERLNRETLEEFQERVDEIRPRLPDYDRVLETFQQKGGSFAPHVRDALLQSDVGAELAYYLASNPGIATALNQMLPIQAHLEIGSLRSKVEVAKPKKQTTAPQPLKSLSGGASPPRDLGTLAKSDDVSDYVAERQKQEKNKR